MLSILASIFIAACGCTPEHEDPRIAVPPYLYGISNTALEVYFDNLSVTLDYTDYVWAVTGAGSVGATKWTYTPGAVGDTSLTFQMSQAGYLDSGSTTLRVTDGTIAATKVVLVGDSLTDNAVYPDALAALVGGSVTFLGTKTTAGGTKHDGESGKYWCWFAQDAASPMTSAANTIDIAAYVTAIGATPDVIVWQLGINSVYTATLAQAESTITTELGCAATLIAAWQAAYPAAIHGISITTPGNAANQPYYDTYSYPVNDVYYWRQKNHRVVERLIETYSASEGSGIYLIPANLSIDRVNGYPSDNAVHPNNTGYEQIATVVKAWLAYVR
jgi:lysophospholipase L1-like esterase